MTAAASDSSSTARSADPGTTVHLEGDLCIGNAQELHRTLLEVGSSSGSVELDVRKVTRVDIAGLQLLVALCVDLRRDARAVNFRNVPEAARKTAAVAGLLSFLGWDDASSTPS